MKLPSGDRAVVEDAKLLDYCLSTVHPVGKHKARLFAAALGITAANADVLQTGLLAAARDREATLTRTSVFGHLYEIRFPCTGPAGTAAC
jgi:hypothetical protein